MNAEQRNAGTLLEDLNRDYFHLAGMSAQLLSQASNGRCVEQGADREVGIQAGVDRGDQTHRRQRIATQIEKRVIHPDPVQAQHLGVDAGQDLLDRVGRGPIPAGGVFGCGQGAGVEFAVGGQRQRVDHHHRGRDHVGRQPLAQPARAARISVPVGRSVM